MNRLILVLALTIAGVLTVAPTQARADSTLATVKARGVLNCGANGQLPGFGIPDAQGNWTGFDVDYCRAIAAAIFNDPTKVKFVPLTAKDRFTALQSGDIDVLIRNTSWISSRDTQFGLNATAANYFDGQGFIVRKVLKVNSALELGDASVCVQQGTTSELNLADYFRSNRMRLKTVTFATLDEALKAFERGVSLTRHCHTSLQAAQQKVEVLLKRSGQAAAPEPFEEPAEAATGSAQAE